MKLNNNQVAELLKEIGAH